MCFKLGLTKAVNPGKTANWVSLLTWGSLPSRPSEEGPTEQWGDVEVPLIKTFMGRKQRMFQTASELRLKNCLVCFGLGLHT